MTNFWQKYRVGISFKISLFSFFLTTIQTLPSFAASNPASRKDNRAPIIKMVSSPELNGEYTSGSVLAITIQFNETVYVTGVPNLVLETGSSDAKAAYTSGSGTQILRFTYSVLSEHVSPDLNYQSIYALLLNGGTIKDAARNSAKLALPSSGSGYALSDIKNLVINPPSLPPPPPPTVAACGGNPDLDFNSSTNDRQALLDLIARDADKKICVTGTADMMQSVSDFYNIKTVLPDGTQITGDATIRGSISVPGFRSLQSSDSVYVRTPADARSNVYIATLPAADSTKAIPYYTELYQNAGESVWPTGKETGGNYYRNHPVQIFHKGKRLKESAWPFDGAWARITQAGNLTVNYDDTTTTGVIETKIVDQITATNPPLPVLPSTAYQNCANPLNSILNPKFLFLCDNALWFDIIPKTYQQEVGQIIPSTTSIILNHKTATPVTAESSSHHGGLIRIRNFGPEGFVPNLVKESVYWIDRTTGQIALYLVGEALGEVRVSALYEPLISIGSNTLIDGLKFVEGNGNGIYVSGSGNKLTNLTMRGFSQAAIQFSHIYRGFITQVPTQNEISYSKFFEMDQQAISMQTTQSEHLRTLTSHGHKVHHNEVFNVQQFFLNPAAIEIKGVSDTQGNRYNHRLVGVEISDNHIHDTPGMAVSLSGAKNQILRNLIDHTTYMLTDWAAIYTGRSLIGFGNLVAYNTIQNIRPLYDQGPINYPEGDTMAIYFDDGVSGPSAVGNTMINVDRMGLIGGGSYLHFDNNQCSQCSKSIHWGKWGVAHVPWMKQMATDLNMDPIWVSTYPDSQLFLDSTYDGSQTYGTTIQGNFFNGVPVNDSSGSL